MSRLTKPHKIFGHVIYPKDDDIAVFKHEKNVIAVGKIIKNLAEYEAIGPPSDLIRPVRCGECRFNTSEQKCLHPDSIIKIPKDTDYCSYGERKAAE